MSVYSQRAPFLYLFKSLFGHFRILSCGNGRYCCQSFLRVLMGIWLPYIAILVKRDVQRVLPLAIILGVLAILVDAYPAWSPMKSQLRAIIVFEFVVMVVLNLLVEINDLAWLMTSGVEYIRLIFQLLYFILHIVNFFLKSFILCIRILVGVVLLVTILTQRGQEGFVLEARQLHLNNISRASSAPWNIMWWKVYVSCQDVFLRVAKLIIVRPTITMAVRGIDLQRIVLISLHLGRISLTFERAFCRHYVLDLITVLINLIPTQMARIILASTILIQLVVS